MPPLMAVKHNLIEDTGNHFLPKQAFLIEMTSSLHFLPALQRYGISLQWLQKNSL
jgi:hypothetical protein